MACLGQGGVASLLGARSELLTSHDEGQRRLLLKRSRVLMGPAAAAASSSSTTTVCVVKLASEAQLERNVSGGKRRERR